MRRARYFCRVILGFGLSLVALGDGIAAVAALVGLGYWAAALGIIITGSGAGLLNSESAKVNDSTAHGFGASLSAAALVALLTTWVSWRLPARIHR